MGWGAAVRIELSDAERSELQARARRRKIARADAMRAEIVLLAADGMTNLVIAERLGITRVTVAMWRKRFAAKRLDGLVDAPRPGAPRQIGDDKIAEVVTTTLETMPAAATHWSTRSLARATGVSTSTVHRIWRAFSLQPHRSETFKLSTDPLFVEKVRDIVGLYLDPPERALVLCVDEKSQIQALDRTQPLLPMRPGQAERRTHDYKRHGTTSLFAALDVKAGTIISKCMPRHRAQEFRRFIGPSEAEVFWSDFLKSLKRRGLTGIKLVISDAHEGLKAAITRVLGATWQRCRVHWTRNALACAQGPAHHGRRCLAPGVPAAGPRGSTDGAAACRRSYTTSRMIHGHLKSHPNFHHLDGHDRRAPRAKTSR